MSSPPLNIYPTPYHWHLSPFFEYKYQSLARLAAAGLGADDVLLDLGCGDGRMSALLADRAGRVVGVDNQLRPLQFARLLVETPRVRLLAGNVGALPFADNAFSVATCFEVVEHLDAPTTEGLLAEARRVLISGGRLLLSTPNRASLRKRVFGGYNPKHRKEYRIAEIVALVRRHGFRPIALTGLYVPLPLPGAEHFAGVIPFRFLFKSLVRLGRWLPGVSETIVLQARNAK